MLRASYWRVGLGMLAVSGLLATSVAAQSPLAPLGLTEDSAKNLFISWLESGTPNAYQVAKPFKAATPEAKPKLMANLLGWMKTYSETPDFRAAYAKLRNDRKPASNAPKGTADDQLAKQRAEQRKAIDQMKVTMKSLPPDMQKDMAQTIKDLEAQLAAQEKDPEMQAMLRRGTQGQLDAEAQRDKERLATWEQRFPADARPLIARRLREFLQLTGSVDFNAKLVPMGSKMVFADPRYEKQSSEWKLYFRAGKPTVDAMRGVATDWLRQLDGK